MILIKLSNIPQFRPSIKEETRILHNCKYVFRLCQLSATKYLVKVRYYEFDEIQGTDYYKYIGTVDNFSYAVDYLIQLYEG